MEAPQEVVTGFVVLEQSSCQFHRLAYGPVLRTQVLPNYAMAESELIRIAQYSSNVLSVAKIVVVASYQKER